MAAHRFDGFEPISSGHLDGVKYDSMEKKMVVRFTNGYQYAVHGVTPEHYQEFVKAPSQGEHFHAVIKPNFHIERVK
jgi:hypothetical protein